MTAVELTDYQRSRAYWMADQAVPCPKCKVKFGSCVSTGGGHYAQVATHKARRDRTADWTTEQRHRYGGLVVLYSREPWTAPADLLAEAEAAAKPIPTKATKPATPRGVRLSENQAEEIERAACNGGKITTSTGHFHGDAAYRQTIHALRDKGILAEGGLVDHGRGREYTMTNFGWDVYLNHRLIIRREEGDLWAAVARPQP